MATGRTPKPRPRLPLSAFTSPQKSGTSESFPSHSPIIQHVLDAHVDVRDGDFSPNTYKERFGDVAQSSKSGVILFVADMVDLDPVLEKLASSDIQIVSISIPLRPEAEEVSLPSTISSTIPFSFHTIFGDCTPEKLRRSLDQNRPIDIDIQVPLSENVLESFGDFIQKSTVDLCSVPPIILSNVLPPLHNLELPIVKLMSHPTYQEFQSQVAALSLFPFLFVKLLPLSWGASILPTSSSEIVDYSECHTRDEWKHRIKMYLAPVLEAFGYQRIVYGSCFTPRTSSIAGDWYNIARESLTELGADQDAVDAIFYWNARKVYGTTG